MRAADEAPLEERIRLVSARIHASTSDLAHMAAQLDSSGAWADGGFRSCAHWLSVNTGVDVWTGAELVRVGHSLQALPAIAAAFAEGRLSFDKVRDVTRVAASFDEHVWLGVAVHASGSQLRRICRAFSRAVAADDDGRAAEELSNRRLHAWWREDGMLEVVATLPREDGAVVMAALESAAQSLASERPTDPQPLDAASQRRPFLPESRPMLRADAFVRVCEGWITAAREDASAIPARQVVVHVDAGVLGGDDDVARCHVEDGPSLSRAAARWLSCDADTVSVVERDGWPIDVGRAQRVINAKLRLALQVRDRGCRFPGCGVPARRTEGHHIQPWADGGGTDLHNLASLCRFHHRRHHDGAFRIRRTGDALHFETIDGTPLTPATPAAEMDAGPTTRAAAPPDITRALDGGAPCHLEHAVWVLAARGP